MKVLVTGGAGFIGSNFILNWIATEKGRVINLDKLTYAGNLENLKIICNSNRHIFIKGDIGDKELVKKVLKQHKPDAVVNFAAESHVDRSIGRPADFIQTNIVGTFNLLEEVMGYWKKMPSSERENFKFLHVSTDEVYGSLNPNDPPFIESSPYAPNSPYSASKASSDHLIRAYNHTYGFPAVITNCSNNYGPYQFPEKLIPLMIVNAANGKALPVYGDGLHIRDWLYVEDHCNALKMVIKNGKTGETYNIGGCNQKTNLEVVKTICVILDEILSDSPFVPYSSLITFIKDRPGHDRRYAIDASKINKEFGWLPEESFETGIRKTIKWYLDNNSWVKSVTSGEYRSWIEINYGKERK